MDYGNLLRVRLRHAYLKFHRCAQLQLANSGVTTDQFLLLSSLAEEDGLRQKDLVELSGSDSSTIAAMIKILEKNEMIFRVRDVNDGRAFQVFLTEKGRQKQKELIPSVTGLRDALSNAIPQGDQEVVLNALCQIDAAMSKILNDKKKIK